ncbi:uncharacterized protein NEMAJ01_1661 [Nematocida major]|uniref:uncharacterized protein n=1 Tax=Nematocida major TaxID=1912982 RepID=UPI0020087C0E|nr:uncharacterized protein NEMAJ01_1661 [Nematocida major]KAH9386765.1 hypothetical protein NEMAJ01_1661 [Nematocida major]
MKLQNIAVFLPFLPVFLGSAAGPSQEGTDGSEMAIPSCSYSEDARVPENGFLRKKITQVEIEQDLLIGKIQTLLEESRIMEIKCIRMMKQYFKERAFSGHRSWKTRKAIVWGIKKASRQREKMRPMLEEILGICFKCLAKDEGRMKSAVEGADPESIEGSSSSCGCLIEKNSAQEKVVLIAALSGEITRHTIMKNVYKAITKIHLTYVKIENKFNSQLLSTRNPV